MPAFSRPRLIDSLNALKLPVNILEMILKVFEAKFTKKHVKTNEF
jgi:hypothetical protein